MEIFTRGGRRNMPPKHCEPSPIAPISRSMERRNVRDAGRRCAAAGRSRCAWNAPSRTEGPPATIQRNDAQRSLARRNGVPGLGLGLDAPGDRRPLRLPLPCVSAWRWSCAGGPLRGGSCPTPRNVSAERHLPRSHFQRADFRLCQRQALRLPAVGCCAAALGRAS